jgi:hypothetical protein
MGDYGENNPRLEAIGNNVCWLGLLGLQRIRDKSESDITWRRWLPIYRIVKRYIVDYINMFYNTIVQNNFEKFVLDKYIQEYQVFFEG